jgi:hypothetical protein
MRNTPASITVIAILHFVFGGLGVLGGVCGGAMQIGGGGKMFNFGLSGQQAAQQQQLQEDMERAMESAPGAQAVQYGTIGFDLIISLTMIVSAVGLLKMRPWGRHLSILYAMMSIGLKLFVVVYAVAFTIPALNNFLDSRPPSGQAEQMAFTMIRVIVIGAPVLQLLFMIYPIIVLIIMFRPGLAAAFRGEAAERDFDDRFRADGQDDLEENENR